MKILNGLFLAAFALSALAQINDPDAAPWIALYVAACAMCVTQQCNQLQSWLCAVLTLASVLWIALLLPTLTSVPWADIAASVSMQTRAVEEAREIGGLALVLIWSVTLLVYSATRPAVMSPTREE